MPGANPQPEPRQSAKKDRKKRSTLKPEARLRPRLSEPPAAPTGPRPSSAPLVGGLLLGVVLPFLTVSLVNPARTGVLGLAIESGLVRFLGLASMLFPLLVLGIALRLLLPRPRRTLQMTWAPVLLALDLTWLAQRMGAQGGFLGAHVDALALALVGPTGSWLLACACLPLSILFVCRIPPQAAGHGLASLLHWFQDRGQAAWETAGQVDLPLRLPQPPTFFTMEDRPAKPVLPGFEVENLAGASRKALPAPSAEPEPSVEPVPASQEPLEGQPGQLSFETLISLEPLKPVIPEVVSFAPPEKPVRKSPPRPVAEETLRESVLPVRMPTPPESVEPPTSPEPASEELPEAEPTWLELPEPQEPEPSLEPPASEEPAAEPPGQEEEPVAEPVALEEESAPWEDEEEELPPPPPAPKSNPWEDGVLEDPDGQLRLFPGPVAQPAAVYKLPPLSILNEASPSLARRPVEDKSQTLLDALASFGVQASLLALVRGPAVTRYELQPARGVKVSRFTSLTNDIALALAATAVRIEAPIPGKSAIGIEIPNENTDLVVLKDILASQKFRKSVGLSIALGKDLSGTPTFTNLQKMPHLLVAGTTGSGKSVCVNGLILSLLYRFTPRQLQILMIDPKQVELSIYEGIPHLITFQTTGTGAKNEGSIIVDPKRAAMALHQIVELMEQRYGQFAAAKVRNLEEYNATCDPLPWVVVIIDELADLMMVASKTVETSICRIAQKARAAGIHLVLATQRPSADVITGLIKVNIPSRVAFAVSSQVDSRVILDTGGAEQLLGKGDMLFCPVDASDPRRLQGCFVTNEEILRVVEWWRAQACPENLIELAGGEVAEEGGEDEEGSEDDALVEQALQVVVRRRQASASLLQTELKVGYARARRLVYLMEKKGYIGPAEGSKPRKILYTGG